MTLARPGGMVLLIPQALVLSILGGGIVMFDPFPFGPHNVQVVLVPSVIAGAVTGGGMVVQSLYERVNMHGETA